MIASALPVLLLAISAASPRSDFEREQRAHERVRGAFAARAGQLRAAFHAVGAQYPPASILLRAFKRERVLELWASRRDGRFVLVESHPICASSGVLGPKRREGDGQVPEGFYAIRHFNPASAYHLSLGIDYPNPLDRAAAGPEPGGAIYIHGDCVTVGCVPLGDARIEEVYVAAVLARTAGQRAIPVHIFPARLTDAGFARLAAEFAARPELVAFWGNLKEGFDRFEAERTALRVEVTGGKYRFR